MTQTIGEVATVVRSKNAGPFTLTFDVFFDRETYERVSQTEPIDEGVVAEVFGIPTGDVRDIYYLNELQAVKVSIERPVPSGDVLDTDIYGAQQHVPLLEVEIPQ